MLTKVLLIEDVENLGRQGDLVEVKAGYARNYLLPKKKAFCADKNALRRQKRLQEERIKRAEEDKKESMIIAEQINDLTYTVKRKVDEEGHMYGSVSVTDIVNLLEENKIIIEKRHVVLAQPIKKLGAHTINLKLKENVEASFTIEVASE